MKEIGPETASMMNRPWATISDGLGFDALSPQALCPNILSLMGDTIVLIGWVSQGTTPVSTPVLALEQDCSQEEESKLC